MLGEKIYYYRTKMGLTQKELAAQLNVTNKAISKWETNTALPKTETIIKLAEIFDVSPEELLNVAIESKKEKNSTPTTLKKLCEQTEAFLQEGAPEKPLKNQYGFTTKTAKIYLITTGIVLLITLTGLLLLAFSFYPLAEDLISIQAWFSSFTFLALLLTALYTGFFYYITYFKSLPLPIQIVSLIMFQITFLLLSLFGIILIIPTVINSIRILIKSKKRCENEQ